MKTPHTPWITWALAAALAGSTGAALAQMGPGGMGSPASADHPAQAAQRMDNPREHRKQERQARQQKHLADLQRQLQLQPPQEAAWNRFAQAMQPLAQPPARLDRASWEKMSTPERIDRMQALHAEREARMKQRADATKALYAALNPEQQKTFDAHTARFMGGLQRAHHGMHPGAAHGAQMPMHGAMH